MPVTLRKEIEELKKEIERLKKQLEKTTKHSAQSLFRRRSVT